MRIGRASGRLVIIDGDGMIGWAGRHAGPSARTCKKLEIPVKRILPGGDPDQVVDAGAVDNPDTLPWFAAYKVRTPIG